MKKNLFTKQLIKSIAKLSKLSVDEKEETYFSKQFNETINIVDKLNQLNTESIPGTDHVTGLNNVFREDKISKERILSQEEALSNAKNSYAGYFMVKAIFDEQ